MAFFYSFDTCKSMERNDQHSQKTSISLEDRFCRLPSEIVIEIFSRLNLATLGRICSVSKDWEGFASEPNLWKKAIYKEIAFGNDKWAQSGGIDLVKEEDEREEFSSLPWREFIEDCKKFQRLFPKKRPTDTLMLLRIPKTLTLKNLGELSKQYFRTQTGYKYIADSILTDFGNKAAHKSYWVIMTKDVLPGSRNKSYKKQKEIIAELGQKSIRDHFLTFSNCIDRKKGSIGEQALIGYEVPEALEAAACILAEYFICTRFLFSNSPWTYTPCKENQEGKQSIVGGLSLGGLSVGLNNYIHENVGIAVLRKF